MINAVKNPIPVTVITGFLGSGKTTLLNRLLKDPELSDTAVIINEFGEVSIDHLLVEKASEDIIELADGCVCCTVRGELVDTLAELIERLQTGRIKSLKRVVIETTGLADPAPVLQSIMGHPVLMQVFRLDGVVTTIDAVNAMSTLDQFEEAVKQVAMADRIVVTKTDLIEDKAEENALIYRLKQLNPGAEIIYADEQRAGVASLFECGLYNPETKTADVRRWLQADAYDEGHQQPVHICTDDCSHDHHHHSHKHDAHHQAICSFSLVYDDGPIPFSAFEMFVDLLRSAHGEKILRMKAIVQLAEDPERPLVLHGVQRIFHPPARLAHWPDGKRETRLVLIVKDLSEDYVRELFDAFTDKPRIDQADRSALMDNPLAIPGYSPKG